VQVKGTTTSYDGLVFDSSTDDGAVIIYFVSAAVAIDVSHMTASSSTSWSRFSPPSNFVNGHVSVMWFMDQGIVLTVKPRQGVNCPLRTLVLYVHFCDPIQPSPSAD